MPEKRLRFRADSDGPCRIRHIQPVLMLQILTTTVASSRYVVTREDHANLGLEEQAESRARQFFSSPVPQFPSSSWITGPTLV